jgi:putative transposase
MDTGFCVEVLEEVIGKHGRPEIFNSDQGSQFTSEAFTGVVLENGIAISVDRKGSWRDNVFVERLLRSVKYEEVYLKAYDTVAEARTSLDRYFRLLHRQRRIRALNERPRTSLLHDAALREGRMKFPLPQGGWTSERATPASVQPTRGKSTLNPGRKTLIKREQPTCKAV